MIGYQAGGARLGWCDGQSPPDPGLWCGVAELLSCLRDQNTAVSSADAGVQVSSLQGWCRSQISSSRVNLWMTADTRVLCYIQASEVCDVVLKN